MFSAATVAILLVPEHFATQTGQTTSTRVLVCFNIQRLARTVHDIGAWCKCLACLEKKTIWNSRSSSDRMKFGPTAKTSISISKCSSSSSQINDVRRKDNSGPSHSKTSQHNGCDHICKRKTPWAPFPILFLILQQQKTEENLPSF